MAIDRSKFKPTTAAKMQEATAEVDAAMSRGEGGGRPDMVKLKEGKNTLRVYPAHPDTDGDFCKPSVKVFLPMMVKENVKGEDGKWTKSENEKEGQRPVFNARIHGGKKKDLVEEYIALARKIAEAEIENKDVRQKYLDKVYGKYSKNANERVPGISYKTAYVLYVKHIEEGKFGRLEVGKLVKESMNKIAANEASGEPLGVDPFTDPDDGRALIINYNKSAAKPSDYYTVSLDTSLDKKTKMAIFYPITEEELEEFAGQPTLQSMYVNVFTKKDLELQLAGLEYFDQVNKMKIWDRAEWVEIMEEIVSEFGEDPDEDEEVDPGETDNNDDDEDEDSDQFTLMNRVDLKAFSAKHQLGVTATKQMSDEDLRERVRAAHAAHSIPHIPLPGDDDYEEEDDEDVKEEQPAKKGGALDRVKGLGKKRTN